jgi:adenylate cyclase
MDYAWGSAYARPHPVNARLSSFFNAYGFALFAPLVALFLVALLNQTGWVQRLENLTISLRFHVRAPWDPPADSRLLLVGIDQQSIDHIGAWPWQRTVEADFLKSIAASGMNPRTVAFDLLLTDNHDPYHVLDKRGEADMDTVLGDAAGLLPSVITGAQGFRVDGSESAEAKQTTELALKQAGPTQPYTQIVGDRNKIGGASMAILPVEPLRKQSLFGFVDDTPSLDGVHYRLPVVVRIGDSVYPSLALQTVCQILHVDADEVTVHVGRDVTLKNSSGKSWRIPIDDQGQIAINYRNPATYSTLNFGVLLQSLAEYGKSGTPIPASCNIDKKALLIGQVADGLAKADIGPTPLEARSPLVYTHFNVINSVLTGDYLQEVPTFWIVIGYLVVSWLSLFGLRHSSIVGSVGVPTAVIIAYFLVAVAIFWVWSIEIAMAWPMAAYFGVQVVRGIRLWREEARSRQQLKTVFSQMLSPEVMNHVLSHPGGLELGGTTREVTILFSDIRDFTKISENIATTELVRQLNEYFAEMVGCVTEQRGTFHKFIGDAIMAVWGDIASVSSGPAEDARAAVGAALEMRRKLAGLNRRRVADGLLPLRIGIGLNHGEVLVGQIGAAQRSEFTVIGDAVNVASRLEGMTKEFHTDLAIGEGVQALLGDAYRTRRLGFVQLKGKSEPMMVFEVLDDADEPDAWSPDDLRIYHQALDQFLARDFSGAEAGFAACLERHPDDYCVQRYGQAAGEFRVSPPPADWDGRLVMETK